MRKTFLIAILFLFINALQAQKTINLGKTKSGIIVKQSKKQNVLHLSFSFSEIQTLNVKSKKGEFTQLMLNGAYRTGAVGNPQLPSVKKLIEIPYKSKAKIKVINYETTDYVLSNFGIKNKIIPYQPSISKSKDPVNEEFKYKKAEYKKNEFTDIQLGSINNIGTLHGINLAQISINPIKYNPAKNTIKVYNNIDVEITFENTDEKKTKEEQKNLYSPYFQTINKLLLNKNSVKSAYPSNPDHTKYPVKYLIVTAPEFKSQLKDFIAWKTLKGFKVITVTTDEIGTSATDIKTWIHTQYHAATTTDPAPTFLLLVGDDNKIPASRNGASSGLITDLYYACMDEANDILPDMYYGRLSARTNEHLQNMLDKILYYEQYKFTDDSFLNKVTMIAGVDATYNSIVGQPTINYGTTNYFNAEHGFTQVNKYLNSYGGCYSSNNFKTAMFSYTAHCSPLKWLNPQLTISNVKNLNNENQYPLVLANCCESGKFSYTECIAEAWMRQAKGGAIAYIGSVPETYWYEDFYWAVGAHSFVGGHYPSVNNSSLGAFDAPFNSDYLCVDALAFVGNLAVTEAHDKNYSHSTNSRYYWEAYHCFSDPSLFIYFTQGKNNAVTHKESVLSNINKFTVSAEPGSYVAISRDTVLHGTALVPQSGTVDVPIKPFITNGYVDIVVTRSQYKPYKATIPITMLNQAYIDVNEFITKENIKASEKFNINLKLKNIGLKKAEDVRVSINTKDKYIYSISKNVDVAAGNIEKESIKLISNNFYVVMSDSVPDQHIVEFDITINHKLGNDTQTQTYKKSIMLNAPDLQFVNDIVINDSETNNNGMLEPGETAKLSVDINNIGHAQVSATASMNLLVPNNYLTIEKALADTINLNYNETKKLEFTIKANSNAPTDIPIALVVKTTDKNNPNIYFNSKKYQVTIGKSDIILGNEKIKVDKYPLDNYYENNKTQILYLNEELSQEKRMITSIALDIAEATSDEKGRELKNFAIKIKELEQDTLYNFIDMSNAEDVLTTNSYKLSGKTGWEKFVFTKPFSFSGTKNILVQILWGDNGEYTKQNTKVYTSTTGSQTVAYGYNDNQTPPNFKTTSDKRPNTCLHMQNTFKLQVKVLDKNVAKNIKNAIVTIGDNIILTDTNGIANFNFLTQDTSINYLVEAKGYFSESGKINISEILNQKEIKLKSKQQHIVKFKVNDKEENKPLSDVEISFNKKELLTDNMGEVSFSEVFEYEKYIYKIYKKNYFTYTDTALITKDTTIQISLRYYFDKPNITSIKTMPNGDVKILWENKVIDAILQDTDTIFKDDFEQYNNWETSFGNYTLIDKDASKVFASDDYDYPNETSPVAFKIMNYTQTTPAWTKLNAVSGEKIAATFCAKSGKNNDWIITPKIQLGVNSEFSFYAKSVIARYGLERFKVGISTTNNNIEDFKFITGENYIEANTDWTKYAYNLAKYSNKKVYLAIQCVSADAFVFAIDDLIIAPSKNTEQIIKGYSIYLSDLTKPIATEIKDNEYIYSNLVNNKTYTIGIVANYAEGDSKMQTQKFTYKYVGVNTLQSNNIEVYPNPTSGVLSIDLKTVKGCELNIYNKIGQLVKTIKQTKSIEKINLNNKSKGIYIIKISNPKFVKTYKVVLQ